MDNVLAPPYAGKEDPVTFFCAPVIWAILSFVAGSPVLQEKQRSL